MAGEMATGLSGASKTSSVGSIAGVVVPLLLSLFGSKKASPQNAAKTTSEQNALAMQSLPPEIKALLNIQTQNAQAAQPLYMNALSATNALLPSWARGGGSTGSALPSTGSSTVAPNPGAMATGQSANVTYGDDGGKTSQLSNPDSPFSGAAVDNGLVPGNSLDPRLVMEVMSMLTGNPAFAALSRVVKKPVTSDTNFTLT